MVRVGMKSLDTEWNANGEGIFPIMIDAEKLRGGLGKRIRDPRTPLCQR